MFLGILEQIIYLDLSKNTSFGYFINTFTVLISDSAKFLRTLNLSDCCLDISYMKHITKILTKCNSLEYLELQGNFDKFFPPIIYGIQLGSVNYNY